MNVSDHAVNAVIADRLARAIAVTGMTPNEFARYSGINEHLYRYLNGSSGLRVPQLLRLCEALDVSPNYLLGWGEDLGAQAPPRPARRTPKFRVDKPPGA